MAVDFTPQGIAEQRKVCEAATVAPWSWGGDVLTSHWTNVISVFDNEGGASFSLEIDESDRAFIALSRTAYPAALDEIERLRPFEAECAALRERLAAVQAERDAAVKDLTRLSDEFKFCRTCLYDHGHGIDDCNKYGCDMKNQYEWRGLCADNALEGAESEGKE